MEQDARNIIAQVESLPELIRSEFETLDMRVRRLLNHNDCLSVKRIMIVGAATPTWPDWRPSWPSSRSRASRPSR